MRTFHIKTSLAIVLPLFFLIIPVFAHAGALSLYPATGSFEQGKTFSTRVVVTSADQAINAISGVLSFPTDKLRVISLSKSDSILSLWVQDPSFSNGAGTINFEGVVPNPGFTGSSGNVLLITFKVLAPGDATVKFTSGTLLANDGQGTDVTKDLKGATYTLTAAKAEEVKPLPTPVATPVIEPETPAVVESIKAPIFTEYPRKLEEGAPLKIHGTSYPEAVVEVSLRDAHGQVFTQIVQSDGVGEFSLLWPNKLNRSDYELTGIATFKSVKSLASDPLPISIIPTPTTLLKFTIIDYGSLIVTSLIFLLIILLILLYLYRGLKNFKRKIWRDANDAEKNVHIEFDQLKEAVRKELLVLEDVQTKRELTKEEAQVLEKISKHIARIEKNINKRIQVVKNDIK